MTSPLYYRILQLGYIKKLNDPAEDEFERYLSMLQTTKTLYEYTPKDHKDRAYYKKEYNKALNQLRQLGYDWTNELNEQVDKSERCYDIRHHEKIESIEEIIRKTRL